MSRRKRNWQRRMSVVDSIAGLVESFDRVSFDLILNANGNEDYETEISISIKEIRIILSLYSGLSKVESFRSAMKDAEFLDSYCKAGKRIRRLIDDATRRRSKSE